MKQNAVNKSGFTLIEILIVVLIIGLLASIALPGYRKAVEKSKASEALSNLSALSKSEHSFYLAKNKYTDKFSDLDIQLQGTMDEEVLKTEYFDYELLSTGVLASRNNKEYSIYQDYETSQIMCTPGSHYICENLGAFTKEPCEKVGLAWANTNSTCYANEEARCKGLYDDDTWNGEFCGYTNTNGQTIGEGMKCDGSSNSGCFSSTINKGGVCSGTGMYACTQSVINDGGICIGSFGHAIYPACKGVTINSGGICKGKSYSACSDAIVNGGICEGYTEIACQRSTFNGGTCYGKDGWAPCFAVVLNSGAVCEGDNGSACRSAIVNDASECHANASGACNLVTYNGTGCCRGQYCTSDVPKCNCPIDETTGRHKTSC